MEVGPDVAKGLSVGDRVAVDPNISCRTCSYCHNARPHLCRPGDCLERRPWVRAEQHKADKLEC